MLAAVAPLATSTDLANATDVVLARLDALPAPDVSAAVAPLATTEQLAGTEARTLHAIADIPAPDVTATLESYGAARTSDLGVLAAAIAVLTPQPGQGARFMRASIPPTHLEVAVENASPIVAGTFIPFTAANASNITSNFATVTEGGGAGVWRYTCGSITTGGFQRFDMPTGQAVGPRYNAPATSMSTTQPFVIPLGKYIYVGALGVAAGSTGGAVGLYRFDIETCTNETLAAFPKKIMMSEGVAIDGGRLLVTSQYVDAVRMTAAACSFFIYDTNTNLPPVEVVVNVHITRFPDYSGEGMRTLPGGAVLIVDKTTNTSSTKQSALLTVGEDNTITISAPEETGSPATTIHNLPGTPVGAHLFSYATGAFHRTYVEGQGLGPASLTLAHHRRYRSRENCTSSGRRVASNLRHIGRYELSLPPVPGRPGARRRSR